MTFVKMPGEDPTQVAGEAAIEGLGAAAVKAVDGKVDDVLGVGEKAVEAVATVKALAQGGAKAIGEKVLSELTAEAKALGGKIPVTGIAGDIAGGSVGITGGLGGGLTGGQDLPIFEDKAITSFKGGAAGSLMAGGPGGGLLGAAIGGVFGRPDSRNLKIEVASGEALDVREFSVQERLSSLFQVTIEAVSRNHDIDFDSVVGHPARFTLHSGAHERFWSGLCNHFEQVRVEPGGLSTYEISIVPALWLLTQRKNYRMFQQLSEPDIVLQVLKEWNIEPEVQIDRAVYKKRKYRVQYAESDFAFLGRMLEDAGITFYFEQVGDETKLVLSDAPHTNPKREQALLFADDTSTVRNLAGIVTGVRMRQRVRPGKYTIRDHDYRRQPSYKLMASASGGRGVEDKLERFHYAPGAFLFGTEQGDTTPVADDRGKTRTDEKEAAVMAQKRLDAKRGSARVCTFATTAHDVTPGIVMSMSGHPHGALGDDRALLVVESRLKGKHDGNWEHHCEARGTEVPFRPDLETPKPKVNGVESATVVGPEGEEIHTDEFGRVRVHFHWDRESQMDDKSSCWIHVNQPWSGSGFGAVNLPRIGQEVLVDFLGGDPDRPVIVGRVFTNLQKAPYKLPDNKTQSGWKTSTSPGGVGFNELRFEDAKGKELLHLQAEKNFTEVIKNNQSSTVLSNRSADVTASDSVTVGGSQSFNVVGDQSHTIGKDQNNDIVGGRSSTINLSDVVDVGVSQSLTVGDGIGYIFKNDKTILITTSLASIKIDGNAISLDAKGNISIAANGELILSGSTVKIDGGPNVLLNCTKKVAANVRTTGKAKLPKKPKGPGSGGETSKATEKLERPTTTQAPLEFENEQLPPAKAADVPELGSILDTMPLSPAAAPPFLEIGKDLDSAITGGLLKADDGDALSKILLVKEEASQGLNLYKLAKDEGMASLASNLQVFGPLLLKPVGTFGGLGSAAIEDLVNVGNMGGIFHVGSGSLPMAQPPPFVSSGMSVFQGGTPPVFPQQGGTEQFMALRTQSAPWSVNGHAVEAQARVHESQGVPSKIAYARALNDSGVALYQGNFSGSFSKVDS